jgi:hypothetical protein
MKDTEHRTQVAFSKWLNLHRIFHFAIPNGGARNAITGARLKAEGVLAGVPDLFIPLYKLFIEMKATKGRLSPVQEACHIQLRAAGYNVSVCRSLDEGIAAVDLARTARRTHDHRNC